MDSAMVLAKRYCVERFDGTFDCVNDGFWYSTSGIIVKWVILASIFFFFMGWFLGGYIHAKQRLKKGRPLLAYHRFLISYQERKKYGQTAQSQFSFYTAQNPYASSQHQQRPDGTWPEPPPVYNGADGAPPSYAGPAAAAGAPSEPAGATKMAHHDVEMAPYPTAPRNEGATAAGPDAQMQHSGATEGQMQGQGQEQQQQLPPRPPQQAKMAVAKLLERFRR